jgi:hypothetical protein
MSTASTTTGLLDIVAAVNDDTVLANNLMRSPVLSRPGVTLRLQRGYSSAALAYSAALRACVSDIVVFVHQDVYLPRCWEDRLMESIALLRAADPMWAVLGIYGVRSDGRQVGCVWSSGLNAVFGGSFEVPTAVESIDEVVIVLRRSSSVDFDTTLPGFHLYATDLVQTALSRGKGTYVIFAPVVHNSRPVLYLGHDYFEAYNYVARKWMHRLPIRGNVATILEPGPAYLRLRARHRFKEWRHAQAKRADRSLDCVAVAQQLGFE